MQCLERPPQIGPLGFQPIEPEILLCALYRHGGAFGEAQHERCVPSLDDLDLIALAEPFGCVVTNGFQQNQTGVARHAVHTPNQAMVEQRG